MENLEYQIFLERVKALYLTVQDKSVYITLGGENIHITKEDVRLLLAVTALDLVNENHDLLEELKKFINKRNNV